MGKRIILGVTGGVAAYLAPKIVTGLIDAGHEVRIVMTDPGLFFIKPVDILIDKHPGGHMNPENYFENPGDDDQKYSGEPADKAEWSYYLKFKNRPDLKPMYIWRNKDEWPVGGFDKGDPVRHIEFREWADIMLIAPLTASTLGKIANGISDNFLTCIARAWQKDKPLILAPAMNTEMWEDPITQFQLDALSTLIKVSIDGPIEIPRFRYVSVVDPVEKLLACNVKGKGAMADIGDIIKRVNELG